MGAVGFCRLPLAHSGEDGGLVEVDSVSLVIAAHVYQYTCCLVRGSNEGDESATAACRVVSMSCCTQAAKGLHGDPEGMARILVASICTSDALDLVERCLSHR